MANVLKVQLQETIRNLAERGWSRRRIARELAIDRKTIRRYLRLTELSQLSHDFRDFEVRQR